MALITGNTYPVKAALRNMGGVWDKRAKGWRVPDDVANIARSMVRGADSYRSNYTRFSSGAEVYTNKRGRCEDAPCCGCCS